jgi:AbrB family transcriptional regulator, transcriptional pleiotropic regulator of transition state genes
MKDIDTGKKNDELGRIKIPHELCKVLETEKNQKVEIFIEGETIVLRRSKDNLTCAVTGKISNENKVYENNIVLSPEGEEILFKQLLKKKKSSFAKKEDKFIWKR